MNNFAGTSVGAIFAALCAVGYTSDEMQVLINKLDPNQFWPKAKNILESTYGTIKKRAVYSMDSLERYLDNLFVWKRKQKFKDLKIGNNYKLKVITACVNERKLVVLPDELNKFKINSDDFLISKAVCMSSAIPLVYKPYRINDYTFVDGGIFSNFPIWLFEDSDNVLGFRLGKKKKNDKFGNRNIIYIDTSRYKATDFRKGFTEKHYLYNIGYYYTKLFFDKTYK